MLLSHRTKMASALVLAGGDRWYKAGPVSKWQEGGARTVMVNGNPVAVFYIDNTFYAVNSLCPHMGGHLTDGKLLPGPVVACPWHGWTFDLTNGYPDHGGGHGIAAYDVKVDNGTLWVRGSPRPLKALPNNPIPFPNPPVQRRPRAKL